MDGSRLNSLTLETAFPGVYAVGDVTSVGTPKAGVFSEGQAAVVADRISAVVKGTAMTATYGGNGMCYLAFGQGEVARVDVTFLQGQAPFGGYEEPSSRARRRQGRVRDEPDPALVRRIADELRPNHRWTTTVWLPTLVASTYR